MLVVRLYYDHCKETGNSIIDRFQLPLVIVTHHVYEKQAEELHLQHSSGIQAHRLGTGFIDVPKSPDYLPVY